MSYDDFCRLAVEPDNAIELIMCANTIRQAFKGDSVFTCSIINAKSGSCSQDCAFCAQSAFHNTGVRQYPMLSAKELIDSAREMHQAGATKYSFVTSGLAPDDKGLETIKTATRTILQETDLGVCASLGMLTPEKADKLKAGGVTTYHHNLETARSHFDKICTTHTYDTDIETVKTARAAGFRVCSGGILGLGESWNQRVELAFTLKELAVDCIPLNFLNPIPGTRLEHQPLMTPMDALKSIALFRMINPTKDITICGGREVTLKDYQSWIFLAGANGFIVGNYLTTGGRSADLDIQMIHDMGLKVQQNPSSEKTLTSSAEDR
jgi:biotin synthase